MQSEELIGRAAVAMCKQGGFDPYERMPSDGPRWKYYTESARAALEAVQPTQNTGVSDEMVEAAHRYICGLYPYPQSKPETRQMLQEAWNVAALSAAEPVAEIIAQRDALIAAGLKCCDGTPNPDLRPFDLAMSFIDSTNTARKAADTLWQEYKAELDVLRSAPPAPSVAVKALEWRDAPVPPSGETLAPSVVGLYCIPHSGDRFYLRFRDKTTLGDYSTLDKAKAAAQADYEARIRSTLSAQVQDVAGVDLTLSALQSAHVTRQEEWCPDVKPDLSFRGNELGGECGEAQNVIKKLERERHGWRGSRDTVEHLAEELADVIHCTMLVAITAGIDLQQSVVSKFNDTSTKNGLSTMLPAAPAKQEGGTNE